MKARLAIIIAASLGLLPAGTPALAQEPGQGSGQESGSTIRIPAPAPAPSDAVGNPQLRNFSLSGTVTRPSDAPAPVEPAARPEPSRQQNVQRTAPQNEQVSERREAAPAPPPASTQAAQASEPWPGLEQAAPPTPAAAPAPRWDPPAAAAAAIADSPFGGIFPWLLAALFFGGAAAWFFLRQRPRQSYAGAGAIDRFEAPPAPAPPRPARASTIPRPSAPPRPAAEPKTGANSGLVVSTLRPWLEIEFVPIRGMVDEQKAAVAFKVSVFNSGSVPARDILVEACLFNGGPQQDQEIQQFFAYPVAKGDRLPIIPPLKRVEVESGVALQREMLRPIEIEGRALFVPMVAFNVLYSWGSGQGQTSASYLVGKQTKGEKLAPFRLDMGPRIFRNLAEREHQLRLRK